MSPRRLTVLQDTSADEERPVWQWRLIGVLFAVSIWVPLAMLAVWVGVPLAAGRLGDEARRDPFFDSLGIWMLAMPPVVTYAFSCWAAGGLVGRFGGRTEPKDTAMVGGLAVLVVFAICGMARLPLGLNLYLAALVMLLPVGIAAGWLGGRYGVRLRRAAGNRAPAPPP